MAVHARVAWRSQQRVDIQHMVAEQSFAAADFRLFTYLFAGLDRNYIVRGLELVSTTALKVTISRARSMVVVPNVNATSFFVSESDDDPYEMTLPSNSTVFIEGYFERVEGVPVTAAQWDPGAVSNENPAGSEFTSSVDFQEYVELKFRYNTSGFTSNAVKIAKVITGPSSVVTIVDSRDMFYRLAQGGSTPDYAYRYPWSTTRSEADINGDATKLGELVPENPYFYLDGIGARNDKAISSLKSWMDAVMTSLAEIKGSPYWYSSGGSFTGQTLYFDGLNGSSVVPKDDYDIDWDNSSGSERIFSRGSDGPAAWASSYGNFKWYLGGTFSTDLSGHLGWVTETRAFDSTLFDLDLSSSPSSCVVFLKLEREKVPGASNDQDVTWGTGGDIGIYSETQCVHGVAQDFIGIAVGDYVRRITDGYMSYRKVIGLSIDNTNVETNEGAVATAAVTGLVLEDALPSPSIERYQWFKANYISDDLYFTDPTDPTLVRNSTGVLINSSDTDLYMIGRREGDQFYFRDLAQYIGLGRKNGSSYVRENFIVRDQAFIKNDAYSSSFIDYESLFGDVGVISTGDTGAVTTNRLSYINISNASNSLDFGALASVGYLSSTATSNGMKALFAGDTDSSITDIKYVNISSRTSASFFGNLTDGLAEMSSTSSVMRGFFIGGSDNLGLAQNTVQQVEFSNAANATSFGSLTANVKQSAAASNGMIGVVGGGVTVTNPISTVEYFSLSNASSGRVFDSLTTATTQLAASNNGQSVVFAGGSDGAAVVDTMEYLDMTTQASAAAWGVLAVARSNLAGTSNGERGVFVGGTDGAVSLATMDYFSFSSTGNASSFGSLLTEVSEVSATSGE